MYVIAKYDFLLVESEGISNIVQNNDGPSNCLMLRSENSKLEKSIPSEGFESNGKLKQHLQSKHFPS